MFSNFYFTIFIQTLKPISSMMFNSVQIQFPNINASFTIYKK